MWILAYGLGQLLIGLLLGFERGPVGLGMSLIVAVPVVIWGITRRHRMVLRVDAEGIHGASGDLLSDWSGTGVAWIGPGRRFQQHHHPLCLMDRRGNTLIVWTDAAIAFQPSDQVHPHIARQYAAAYGASPDEIAAAPRRFTDRPVYTPTTMELKRLQRWLRDRDAVADPD
jgi:hypothetical protein